MKEQGRVRVRLRLRLRLSLRAGAHHLPHGAAQRVVVSLVLRVTAVLLRVRARARVSIGFGYDQG